MIIDNLILEKCIGKSSFSKIYLSSKKGDSKKYTTKTFERDQIEGSDEYKYLKNEINFLIHLKHPNIIKFEDIKKTKKHFYIVTEFCNGGTLSIELEKYKKKYNKYFPQKIVQHLMRQIIDAFKYIHNKNIIHRNIKMDNILINYETKEDKENLNLMNATAKIIGFGFACEISKNNNNFGRQINMDHIRKQAYYGQKADIWSLGTICYEMLFGKSNFDAENIGQLVSKINDGTYPILTLSKEVISFLNDMLYHNSNSILNCEQLSKHSFLSKNINDFHRIDIQKSF